MYDNVSASLEERDSRSRRRGLRRIVDKSLLKALASALRDARSGRLTLTMPSGESAVLGGSGAVEASVALTNYAPLWKIAKRGLLGVADAYICGDVETPDLHALFDFFLDNEQAITSRLPQIMRGAIDDAMFHGARANTREGSRRNIAAHYDLGNEFYRLWLDPGMSYSSGIYRTPQDTLDQAQAEKHARILEALELGPSHHVLEIGCGWGALMAEIAGEAAHVTGITISDEQLRASRARLDATPFSSRASVRFEDYRDTNGQFDRIASIEMIEAVGEENWPAYFRTISDRLNPGGIAVIQAITIRSDLYDIYRAKPDFIQRYIFPGGMLPTIERMESHAQRAGLGFREVERFGASYALTLAEWRRRFEDAWPRIEALGFDDRFHRMWSYYLTYCEVGFRRGTIDVGLYRLEKPSQ